MTSLTSSFRLPGITVKQLLHFIAAAETGKIAAAAHNLRLAPSAISHSIDQLEANLGVQLCVRHKAKGLVLTPSGEAALIVARNLMTELTDFETLFAHNGAGNSSRIMVGCSTPIAPKMLPVTHGHFSQRFPNATVEFLEEHHIVLQEQLLKGSLDLAFMYDIDLDHRLERVTLLTMHPKVLLPSTHPLAQPGTPETVPAQFVVDESFIVFGGSPMYERYLQLFAGEGIKPNIAFTSRSMATLRAFVGRGQYLGLQYETYDLDMTVDGMPVIAKPLEGAPPVNICIALPRESRPSVLARQWIASAQAMFSAAPEQSSSDHRVLSRK